jgi:hypothetical protein
MPTINSCVDFNQRLEELKRALARRQTVEAGSRDGMA